MRRVFAPFGLKPEPLQEPLVFGLYNGDELLGRYKIEMEHCPHFSAYGLEAAA